VVPVSVYVVGEYEYVTVVAGSVYVKLVVYAGETVVTVRGSHASSVLPDCTELDELLEVLEDEELLDELLVELEDEDVGGVVLVKVDVVVVMVVV